MGTAVAAAGCYVLCKCTFQKVQSMIYSSFMSELEAFALFIIYLPFKSCRKSGLKSMDLFSYCDTYQSIAFINQYLIAEWKANGKQMFFFILPA